MDTQTHERVHEEFTGTRVKTDAEMTDASIYQGMPRIVGDPQNWERGMEQSLFQSF